MSIFKQIIILLILVSCTTDVINEDKIKEGNIKSNKENLSILKSKEVLDDPSFIVNRFPEMDPAIKLIPIIKLIGKLTVSPMINLTLILFELFCIPIIKSKNKAEFKVNVNNNFLIETNIYYNFLI